MENLILFFQKIYQSNLLLFSIVAGLFISILNAIGSILILFWKNPSQKTLDALLSFAAGVMLCASFTSLIIPGIKIGGLLPVLIGIILGVLLIDLSDHLLPHIHRILGYEGPKTNLINSILLFIIAITIHNAPEGLSVGVSIGSNDIINAIKLMFAIGIQNIPEGFSVAASVIAMNIGKRLLALWTGIRSGLVEIPMVIIGAIAVSHFKIILPYAMGFAAGAMIYVISDEIIPETHSRGNERIATWSFIMGISVMLILDIIFT